MLRVVTSQRCCRSSLVAVSGLGGMSLRIPPSLTGSSGFDFGCLVMAKRWSQVSSNKTEGYYRWSIRDVPNFPPESYEVLTSRGSGPGGQGAQSSSNKVELRLKTSALAELIEDDIFRMLMQQQSEPSGALTSDGEWLVVTSHEHRSALKNKEECIAELKEMIANASWVPPVESDPIQTPSSVISKHKVERRKKGAMMKMRNAARRGLW